MRKELTDRKYTELEAIRAMNQWREAQAGVTLEYPINDVRVEQRDGSFVVTGDYSAWM